jgi:hypothetical protein
VQTTSPTDLIVHAGFDMELATCPVGESNRAWSLIGKALSKAPVELSSLDYESAIDELAERADALESDEDDRDRRGPFVDDED